MVNSIIRRLLPNDGGIARKISSTAVVLAAFTVFGKVAAFGKDLIVAGTFGAGDELDAYLIAILLPSLCVNSFAGSFTYALLPAYILENKTRGRSEAQELFSSVLFIGVALFITVTLLLILISPFAFSYLAAGFSTKKMELTRQLYLISIPCLLANGLSILLAAVLNAHEKFRLAAISSSIAPLLATFALMVYGGSFGIFSLALGTIAGYLIELIVLALAVQRLGVRIRLAIPGRSTALSSLLSQYSFSLFSSFITSISTAFIQGVIASLPSGSVSSFNYANKLVALITTVGTMSVGTAVLPYLSSITAERNWTAARQTLVKINVFSLIITLPITLTLWLLSKPIVQLVFERGAFTSVETDAVFGLQQLLALQIPFAIIGMIGVRAVAAVSSSSLLVKIAGSNLFLYFLGSVTLVSAYGITGVAMVISVVTAISTLCIYFFLFRELGRLEIASQQSS